MPWIKHSDTLEVETTDAFESVQKKVLLGKLFAFFDRDFLKGSGLAWTGAPQARRVVPILGRQRLDLPGARLQGLAPALELAAILSDKALYQEQSDPVHLLLLDPGRAGTDVTLELHWNGQLLTKPGASLGAAGLATLTLADLPGGDFQLRFAGDPKPRCEFKVAAYQLAPLVARVLERTADGPRLKLTLRLETFGIPVEGDVRVNGTLVPCREGLLETTVVLEGNAQHSLNLQLASDASLTATVPLLGTRQEERELTSFSTLGQEVKASLLPSADSTEVRGLYLQSGAMRNTPVHLERVDAARGRLTARVALGATTVVVYDPTWTEGPPEAANMHHPSTQSETYKAAEALFRAGKWEESVGPLSLGWRDLEQPHPYWAYGLACAMAQLHRKDEAFNWLERAIRDGWWEWDHLATDPDLVNLHGDPRFERVVKRGRTVLEFPQLQAGESVEFDVPRPLGIVAVGTWNGDEAFEGHACLIPPPEMKPELKVPQTVRPGEAVTLEVGAAEGAQVYLVVKDARLASTDTAATRLASRLKDCAGQAHELCTGGQPNRTTLSSLVGPTLARRGGGYGGGYGGGGSPGAFGGFALGAAPTGFAASAGNAGNAGWADQFAAVLA